MSFPRLPGKNGTVGSCASAIGVPLKAGKPDQLCVGKYTMLLAAFIRRAMTSQTISIKSIKGEWGSVKISKMSKVCGKQCAKDNLLSNDPVKPFYGVWLNIWMLSLLYTADEALFMLRSKKCPKVNKILSSTCKHGMEMLGSTSKNMLRMACGMSPGVNNAAGRAVICGPLGKGRTASFLSLCFQTGSPITAFAPSRLRTGATISSAKAENSVVLDRSGSVESASCRTAVKNNMRCKQLLLVRWWHGASTATSAWCSCRKPAVLRRKPIESGDWSQQVSVERSFFCQSQPVGRGASQDDAPQREDQDERQAAPVHGQDRLLASECLPCSVSTESEVQSLNQRYQAMKTKLAATIRSKGGSPQYFRIRFQGRHGRQHCRNGVKIRESKNRDSDQLGFLTAFYSFDKENVNQRRHLMQLCKIINKCT